MVFATLLAISGTVNFSCQPTALLFLVDDLGKTLGQKVLLDKALNNEVIVVEASDVDPEALKAKIAQVVYGKWVTTEDGYLKLAFDQDAEDAQYNVIEKKVAKSIKAWRTGYAGRYEQIKNRPIDVKELALAIQSKTNGDQSANLPYARLPFELIANLTNEELAREMLVGRAVYASDPTSLQKPIPGAEPLVAERAKQMGELSTELRSMGFGDPLNEMDIAMQIQAGLAPEIHPAGAKVTLNFGGRRLTDSDYQLSKLIDGEGRVITAVEMIPSYRTLEVYAGMTPATPADVKMEAATAHVKQRIDHYASLLRVTAETQKLAVDMPNGEPIAWYMKDALNEWARTADVDFVACVPDSILLFAQNSELYYDLADWMHEQDMGWTKDGSWRTATSWYPWEVRRDRMDRVAFGNLVNRLRSGNHPKAAQQVANEAELRATGSRLFGYIDGSQPALLPYIAGRYQAFARATSIVPFLSAGTRQGMLAGSQMRWSQLPARDRELITDAACARSGEVNYQSQEMGKKPGERDGRKMEPTIWMARPEMKDAVVTLKSMPVTQMTLFASDMNGVTGLSVLVGKGEVDGLLLGHVQASAIGFEIDLGGGVTISSYKPVTEVQWALDRAKD
jgi:hypothetical protein